MPLFETLTIPGGEKNAIIIDLGVAYTKCGFSGENSPRCIVPTEVRRQKNGKTVKVFDSYNTEEFYSVLVDFVHMLYFRHLLVNYKDRRVVICECVLCPTKLRQTIADVFLKHFEVVSVAFVPSHLVALFTMGIPSGLVMDVGYKEAVVIPIYERIPILRAWQSLPLGSEAIHRNIESQLKEKSTVRNKEEESVPYKGGLPESTIEDIKVRCCFVTEISRAKLLHGARWKNISESQMPSAPASMDYPLEGTQILHVDGRVRECGCEVLFEEDNGEESVATMLLDSILMCPMDSRKTLIENIVLMGGTTMLPGFKHRLLMEMKNLLNQPKYQALVGLNNIQFHNPPAKENYVAWLGGAIVGALDTVLPNRSISRQDYKDNPVIPDWTDITEKNNDDRDDRIGIHKS